MTDPSDERRQIEARAQLLRNAIPPATPAAMRAAVTADLWSFKEGTLREKLDWARAQHQRAGEATDLDRERTIAEPVWRSLDAYNSWHLACARWYEMMLADLDALEVATDAEK